MDALRHPSRRRFLKSALATLSTPWLVPSSVFGASAPSNRINIGCIGVGNQGFLDINRLMKHDDAQIVVVCDVNRASYGYRDQEQYLGRDPVQQYVNDQYAAKRDRAQYRGCDATADFQQVLARNDVDAVILVVPDHWHALMTIRACEAGKDVYCEKPLSLTIGDGQAMVKAVRQHGRILQTGSHERSNPETRFACELVRNGRIGQLKRITTFVGFNNKVGPGPGWKPMPVPQGFDYERWLGPAPEVPYHQDRCLYRFRFNYDYSGGQITNFGAHSNDMAQWANNTDHTGPVEVEYLHAEYLPEGSLFNTATITKYRCRYANGVELICQTDPSQVGARFEGTEGFVQTGYGGFFTGPESLATSKIGPDEIHLGTSDDHMRDFLDAVKTRRDPMAPVEFGHRSAIVCHLGNIAIRLKRKLQWDPENEQFVGDDEANALLLRPMREPWQLG